jgi:chromosome segregation ATPase
MRTAELREGLKQLGFTRNMGKETDDLIQQVAIGHSDTKKEMKDMQEETGRFRANLKRDTESIEALKAEISDMREKLENVLSELHEVSQCVTKLQAEFTSTTAALYRLTHSHERMVLEHSEVGRQLESQRQDVTVHEEQTLQRTQAAKRLAERAFEQVRKSTVELEQTQKEFASFQAAHQKLLVSQNSLEMELADAHASYNVLRDEHDMLNLQLTALAHHYTQALETFTLPPALS